MADHHEIDSKIAVIIVAAGRGSRAGDGAPKQYRPLCGTPIIARTISAFQQALPTALILPVIHGDDRDLYDASTNGVSGLLDPVLGGKTRQESVRNGLNELSSHDVEIVMIHDAARPFITSSVVQRLLAAIEADAKAVIPQVPIVDTIVRETANGSRAAIDRTGLSAVQTPQVFRFDAIHAAHEAAEHSNYTDDATVFEAFGGSVQSVVGDIGNFKITTPNDFTRAEQQIMTQLSDIRMGSGFDVHRFDDGDHVWLCGVKVPFTNSLKGHSDADVALHAITDAILAAIADGDIGAHFPPSDDKWRGADSSVFLEFAGERVKACGGAIGHLAVTIICEAPKIRPHVEAMRNRIGETLGLEVSRISVQATTTEKLGFTGRGEGIAAQATATVRLPFNAETL